VTVDGVLVSVVTTAGQTPAQVVQALAAAIAANSTLAAQGVAAVAIGNRLVTTGALGVPSVADAGLSTAAPVPSLSPWGLGLAALVMLLAALPRWRHRTD
jgi:hypothetical protein